MYKAIGKYQFKMACIRALVMIVYQLTNCLISQPKHMLWVLIRTVTIRRFLYRLILMIKKVFTKIMDSN